MSNIITSAQLLAALNQEVLDDAFEMTMKGFRGILPLIRVEAPTPPEAGYKLNWIDMQVSIRSALIDGDVLIGDTTINVATGAGKYFRAGMLLSPKNSTEVILVTSVTADALTVTRGFGGSTATALTDGTEIFIDSVGREENSTGVNDPTSEGEIVENFFQTMDTQLEFSRRALATAQYSIGNNLGAQLQIAMRQLGAQLNRALIRGRKATATVGGKTVSYTGGLKYFAEQTDAINVDGSGALTLTMLDNITETIVKAGGNLNTVVTNTKQARKINTLLQSKYTSQRLSDYIDDVSGVSRLPSDLPLAGFVTNIVLDTNLNDDELLLMDSSKISVVPMAGGNQGASGSWRTVDATQNGQDGIAARVIGDYAFKVKNYKTHTARLYGLT